MTDPQLIQVSPKELPKLSQDGIIKWKDIKNLEDYVNQSGNLSQFTQTDRQKWADATTAAEDLVKHGMGDCDQADWLKQFIVCGNDVLENNPQFEAELSKLKTLLLTN